jgi:hypothetical protein
MERSPYKELIAAHFIAGRYHDAAFYKNRIRSGRTCVHAPETPLADCAGSEQEQGFGMVMWNAVSTIE